jgi:hypothetical protein
MGITAIDKKPLARGVARTIGEKKGNGIGNFF